MMWLTQNQQQWQQQRLNTRTPRHIPTHTHAQLLIHYVYAVCAAVRFQVAKLPTRCLAACFFLVLSLPMAKDDPRSTKAVEGAPYSSSPHPRQACSGVGSAAGQKVR